MFRKILAYLPCQLLYYIGTGISRSGLDHFEWAGDVYQWVMAKSAQFDEWAKLKVWK